MFAGPIFVPPVCAQTSRDIKSDPLARVREIARPPMDAPTYGQPNTKMDRRLIYDPNSTNPE